MTWMKYKVQVGYRDLDHPAITEERQECMDWCFDVIGPRRLSRWTHGHEASSICLATSENHWMEYRFYIYFAREEDAAHFKLVFGEGE